MINRKVRFFALILSCLMLAGALASCGEPAVPKVTVYIEIDGVVSADDKDIMILHRTYVVDEGTNAFDAVAKLCEERQTTYETDIEGMFMSFTNSSRKLEAPAQKTLSNGNVKLYRFVWSLNDELMSATTAKPNGTAMKDYVLKDGDKIVIYVYEEEVTPSAS